MDTSFQHNEFPPAVSSFDPSEGLRKPRRRKPSVDANARVKPKRPAFKRIVQLCSVRDRSEQELMKRLLQEGYSELEAEEAVAYSVECGLVDNLRFADAFIRARISLGKGELAIQNDLEKHGISLSDIPHWPESYGYDEQSQVEAAAQFLQAHPPKAKDLWGAGYRKLIGKGYSSYVSSKAVRIWQEQLY